MALIFTYVICFQIDICEYSSSAATLRGVDLFIWIHATELESEPRNVTALTITTLIITDVHLAHSSSAASSHV